MIQKTFGIYSEGESTSNLFIELGTKHVACWTTTENNEFSCFEFFNADNETKTHLKEIFRDTRLHSKLLTQNYSTVSVVLDNECCLLIPQFNISDAEKNHLLRLAFGETDRSEKRSTEGDVNYLYTVHHHLNELLAKEFPTATVHHKYEWLNHHKPNELSFNILLTCYLEHCIVSIKNNETYLLVQRYSYETPEDVVYFLLNACKQLNIELSEVDITIQGLIETDSELYAELHKYIPNVHLDEAQNVKFVSDAFNEYPAHYFSSFINTKA